MQRERWRGIQLSSDCASSPLPFHKTWRQYYRKGIRGLSCLSAQQHTACFWGLLSFCCKKLFMAERFLLVCSLCHKGSFASPSRAPQKPLLLSLATVQGETASVRAPLVAIKHPLISCVSSVPTTFWSWYFFNAWLLFLFRFQVCNVKNPPESHFSLFHPLSWVWKESLLQLSSPENTSSNPSQAKPERFFSCPSGLQIKQKKICWNTNWIAEHLAKWAETAEQSNFSVKVVSSCRKKAAAHQVTYKWKLVIDLFCQDRVKSHPLVLELWTEH